LPPTVRMTDIYRQLGTQISPLKLVVIHHGR
jgi:hypothetical protein